MKPDSKPAYWTPKRLLLAAVLAGCIVAVAAVTTSPLVGAQLDSSECMEAAAWHRAEGLKWSEKADQDYHYLAAKMADEQATAGGSCQGWELDATGPRFDPQTGEVRQPEVAS